MLGCVNEINVQNAAEIAEREEARNKFQSIRTENEYDREANRPTVVAENTPRVKTCSDHSFIQKFI